VKRHLTGEFEKKYEREYLFFLEWIIYVVICLILLLAEWIIYVVTYLILR
jgi:hypothetical protein